MHGFATGKSEREEISDWLGSCWENEIGSASHLETVKSVYGWDSLSLWILTSSRPIKLNQRDGCQIHTISKQWKIKQASCCCTAWMYSQPASVCESAVQQQKMAKLVLFFHCLLISNTIPWNPVKIYFISGFSYFRRSKNLLFRCIGSWEKNYVITRFIL